MAEKESYRVEKETKEFKRWEIYKTDYIEDNGQEIRSLYCEALPLWFPYSFIIYSASDITEAAVRPENEPNISK